MPTAVKGSWSAGIAFEVAVAGLPQPDSFEQGGILLVAAEEQHTGVAVEVIQSPDYPQVEVMARSLAASWCP